MKKRLMILFILTILITSTTTYILTLSYKVRYTKEAFTLTTNSYPTSQNIPEDIYRILFINLIEPHVEKAIQEYYDDYMTSLPREDPFSYNILDMKKTPDSYYSYEVTLEVQPYVGPHLSVGIDHITVQINLGEVILKQYRHIKTYELPTHYQDILKETWPPKE